MKTQAKRCTQRELAYLSHWRRNGYKLAIDDPVPLSTLTPPMRPGDRSFGQWLLGVVIIIVVLALFGAWFGKAARLY